MQVVAHQMRCRDRVVVDAALAEKLTARQETAEGQSPGATQAETAVVAPGGQRGDAGVVEPAEEIGDVPVAGLDIEYPVEMHIPHVAPGFWEKFFFRPGNMGYPVFDTAVGKVGVYICYDRHFPDGARCLGLNGGVVVHAGQVLFV